MKYLNKPIKVNFEEYLREVHMKAYPQMLDDDLPDSFDAWLSGMDIDILIKFADLYTTKFVTELQLLNKK
jgi:hypothetical protein